MLGPQSTSNATGFRSARTLATGSNTHLNGVETRSRKNIQERPDSTKGGKISELLRDEEGTKTGGGGKDFKPARKAGAKPRVERAVVKGIEHTVELLDDLSEIPAMAAEKKQPKSRNPRQKKTETEDGQPKLKRARVTKPGVVVPESMVSVSKSQLGADHVATVTTVELPQPSEVAALEGQLDRPVMEADNCEQPLSRRKRGWTPPVDTPQEPEIRNEMDVQEQSDGEGHEARKTFGRLHKSFGYGEEETQPESAIQRTKSGQAFKRKRCVDVVKTPKVKAAKTAKTKVIATPKPKAPKAPPKSSRTITAIAVAQYQVVAPDIMKDATDTVSAFFAPRNSAGEPIIPPAETSVEPAKKKRKSNVADGGKKSKAMTKKPAEVTQNLMSPRSALKRIDCQDLLFGTSSQLVFEESPAFLRQYQEALKESSDMDNVPAARHTIRTLGPNGSLTVVEKSGGGMWSVGTRDAHNELLPAEDRRPRLVTQRTVASSPQSVSVKDEGVGVVEPTISNGLDAERLVLHKDPIAERTVQENLDVEAPFVQEDPESGKLTIQNTTDVENLKIRVKPTTKRLKLSSAKQSSKSMLLVAQTVRAPARSVLQRLPSNTKISAQVIPCEKAKSPVKNKTVPTKPASIIPTPTPTMQNTPTTPKRSRSHPPSLSTAVSLTKSPIPSEKRQKARAASAAPLTPRSSIPFVDIDEIQNSDPGPPISPPRARRSRSPNNNPQTLTLSAQPRRSRTCSRSPTRSTRKRSRSRSLTPPTSSKPPRKAAATSNLASAVKVAQFTATLQATLYPLITAAVTGAPRSQDKKTPSWYEKMLLYDPIVLEDLSAWLNSGVMWAAAAAPAQHGAHKALRDAVRSFEAGGRRVIGADIVDGDNDDDDRGAHKGEANPPAAKSKSKSKPKGKPAATVKKPQRGRAKGKATKKGPFDEDVVDADDEETGGRPELQWQVKAWMVQRWCEEYSVCCLWREGLRGGVKAKY